MGELWWSVYFDQLYVGATFTIAVQEHQQRPAVLRWFTIGDLQQILQLLSINGLLHPFNRLLHLLGSMAAKSATNY